MRKILSLLAVMLLTMLVATAQTREIQGRVTDEQGAPVEGASVLVKGTTTGVAADAQGNFRISAKNGDVLVISATNFGSTQYTVTQSTSRVDVKLTRGTAVIDEVVVTAMGQRRTRNTVPYAAQTVNGDEVAKTRSSNFAQGLSGKVSGLEIRQANTMGGSTNVVIRGAKTLSSSNQALFVVDGVPVDNSQVRSGGQTTGRGGYDYGSAVQDLNPDDIESITVLKGAASTALYGSRGGNGVVLITTKKGARGLGITINSSVGFGKYDKSTFAKYQNEYGGGYGAYYEDPTGRFLYRDINGDGVPDLVVPTSEDASYGGAFDPNKMVYQWDAFDPTSANYGKARPWTAAANGPASIFQTAISSNQSVLLTNGNQNGSFKLGYTRTDDKGIMPNSKIVKNLFNFGGTFNVTKGLTAAANVQFTNQAATGRYGTGYDDKNLMTNFRQWFQTNVDVQEQKDAYFRSGGKNVTWNWADPTDLTPIYWDNPYFTRYQNYENDSRNRMTGYVSLNYSPIKGLDFMGRAALDTYDEMQEERQAVGSTTTSSYSRNNRTSRETTYDLLGTYERGLTSTLNLKLLAGTSLNRRHSESIFASTNGGLIVGGIYALSNSKNPPTAPSEGYSQIDNWGNFAGATFTFRDMLTVDGTVRSDKYSTLPKGNETSTYYSLSTGFTFSKLLPSLRWLSYGKVRGNIATAGNGSGNFAATADIYNIGTPYGSAPLASVNGSAANANLLPEKTQSWEIGLEAAFMKNRAGFDITYYNAKTYNQILAVPVSTATGYNSKFLNAGNIRNKGVELTAFGTPVQTKNFSWTINVNWTRNRNKVEELYPGIDNIVLGSFQGGVSLNATLNEPYGTIRGNDYTYVNGQHVINQANGYPVNSASANLVIGNANPDWIGGVNNSLKYKNVSLSWLIDVRQGGDVFSLDLYYGLATGLYPETAGLNDLGNPARNPVQKTPGTPWNGTYLPTSGGVILPGVDATGKPNTIRAANSNYGLFGYARQPNKAFVYDASFVKLREVVLTYSLPQPIISKLKVFKGIDVSLIGRNLWIIHKNLPYADPEEIISAGNLQGYQGGAYPSVKTYTFNLKFRF
jgi:TonB-linked SusC/RagA family outer membrane protein